MAIQCRHGSFEFGTDEGLAVVASFDGGLITSHAGAMDKGDPSRRSLCRLL